LFLGLEIPIDKSVTEHKVSIKFTEKLYRKLVDDNVLLLYKGDFSSSTNANLIEMLTNNFLKDGEIDPDNLKNIVAVIEIIQNVSKHAKVIDGLREGFFAIKVLDGELYLECSNFVKHEDYEHLKKLLEQIKASNNAELEKMYKQKMASSYLSDDDTGGLGLIELARFSENSLSYDFTQTDDNEIFYSISLKTQ
jgi:hypothetical protein